MVRSGKLPLYQQLIDLFRNNIETGVWPPEHRIPNEMEIAQNYDVSRTTVRSALGELARDGLVRRSPAKGTFVVGPKAESDLASLQNLTQGLMAPGPGSSHRAIGQRVVPASVAVARRLQLQPETDVVELIRLRLEHSEPIMLVTSFLPAARVPGIENRDISGRMFYPFLRENYDIRIDFAKTWIEPTVASEHEAALLDIDNHAPCMLISRLLEEGGKPVVATKILLRGDKCKYVISWHTAEGGS